MKVVVDAMCAEFGGIRTYVEHLLDHWRSVYAEDELHVLVPAGSTLDTARHVRHELRVRRPGTLGRPMAQTLELPRLIQRIRPDAVLSTMPSTTLRPPGCPMVVVVHDLRHELKPEQFSASRRFLRRVSYGRTYQLADGFIAVSARTLQDLHDLHPKTRAKPAGVVHHGADHVLGWPVANRRGPSIAFAHHTNKNPDLIIDAWEVLARRAVDVPPLMIVGVSGESRAKLEATITSKALSQHIRLAPFLPDEEFQRTIAEAEMIVFPSDFEGFGLPVVEGMSLGKPVVIGPEKATSEIAGGHAVVMAGWTSDALADAVSTALALTDEQLEEARTWGSRFTWERAVRETRAELSRVSGQNM